MIKNKDEQHIFTYFTKNKKQIQLRNVLCRLINMMEVKPVGAENKSYEYVLRDFRTTGVDAQTCKNIVVAKVINSMTEFKRVIGRGTRVRDDYGKLFGDGICVKIKEEFLKDFNLHAIVRLPKAVFSPYTDIYTNLLFFDSSGPTKEIWDYEQPLADGRRQYTKTKPIQYEEFSCAYHGGEK